MIFQETNCYYKQKEAAEQNKNKTKWSPVTKDKIKAFIGITIHMRIVRLPRISMYCSQDVLIHQQSIGSIMSQTRFLQIWRCVHLANNAYALPRDGAGFDKIYRARQFLVLRNCQDLHRLHRDLSIDETMIPHKGRLSCKQLHNLRITAHGTKRYKLARVSSYSCNGEIFRFQSASNNV